MKWIMGQDSIYKQRGVKDLILDEAKNYQETVEIFLKTAELYNFKLIETPIFEKEILFKRPLGDDSDIVTKEMYTFEDKGGDKITLRPEGTAPVVRSVIENRLYEKLPLKLCYFGPMFRYERPQKGRYRQFHQFGAEIFSEKSPFQDVEGILMAHDFIKSLSINPESFKLHINSLGNEDDRKRYTSLLKQYFSDYFDELSEISRFRFHKNPLRILDSKEPEDIKLIENVPSILDTMCQESKDYFAAVISMLEQNGINYEIDKCLVRGLDYYTETIFEFKSTELGSQSTFLAGGRYDNLVKLLGGPELSGFGWAAGYERVALISKIEGKKNKLIAVISDSAKDAFNTAKFLREEGFCAEVFIGESFKNLLKKSLKISPDFAVFIGENERKTDTVQLKNLTTKEQIETKLEEIKNNT